MLIFFKFFSRTNSMDLKTFLEFVTDLCKSKKLDLIPFLTKLLAARVS